MLSFVAPSGTGKTTLLEKTLEVLVRGGVRVAVLKASHEDHRLDVPGKDSFRFSAAGAGIVGLIGPGVSTLFLESGHADWTEVRSIGAWLAACPVMDFDVVLCEGFSFDRDLPKLRVVRGAWPNEVWDDLVAVAWDGGERPAVLAAEVALLPLDGQSVARWIRTWAGCEPGDSESDDTR